LKQASSLVASHDGKTIFNIGSTEREWILFRRRRSLR